MCVYAVSCLKKNYFHVTVTHILSSFRASAVPGGFSYYNASDEMKKLFFGKRPETAGNATLVELWPSASRSWSAVEEKKVLVRGTEILGDTMNATHIFCRRIRVRRP